MREVKVSVGATLCVAQRFHTQAQAHVFVSESTILLERPRLTSPVTAAFSLRRTLQEGTRMPSRQESHADPSLGLLSFPLCRLFS